MSYFVYKLFHIAGLAMVLTSVSALLYADLSQGKLKKLSGIFHGLGLLLMLVGGFGMLAKLGVSGIPGWVGLKIVFWLFLGASYSLAKRKLMPGVLWGGILLITVAAAATALYKPF